MKKTFIIAGIIFSFLFSTSIIFACQPCFESLGFDKTANQSDLIIIGHKIKDGPIDRDCGEPGYWIVEIDEILKGETSHKTIMINNCYGMCGYGQNIFEGGYIMFLENSDDPKFYHQVEWGCAINNLQYKNDVVRLENRDIPIDEFVKKLGPDATRTIVENTDSKNLDEDADSNSILYYFIAILIILVITTFIIFKIRKK